MTLEEYELEALEAVYRLCLQATLNGAPNAAALDRVARELNAVIDQRKRMPA